MSGLAPLRASGEERPEEDQAADEGGEEQAKILVRRLREIGEGVDRGEAGGTGAGGTTGDERDEAVHASRLRRSLPRLQAGAAMLSAAVPDGD